MSDVHIAPAPAPSAPAPAPAPAPREAIVDQSPVARPAPVGSQAPSKPPGNAEASPNRGESRRETIKRAFERAPGMGHNNPPEPMAKERMQRPDKPKTEPGEHIDLKKRPADQAPPPRGEHGHFAARPPAPNTMEARQRQPGAQPPARPAAPPLPDHAPYREPPSQRGWSQAARAEWAAAPESVRGDVYRMHKEFRRAYKSMQADRQVMDSIRHFHTMAQQHGTTLDRALTNYVGIEQQLRADPIAGLNQIVENLNLRSHDGQKIGLRDIAWYLNNQTPEQHQLLQARNQQTVQQQQMGQLYEANSQLARQVQQLVYGMRFSQTRGQVDRFAETHPRLDELGEDIKRELGFGYDLPTAYRRAELLRPSSSAPAAHAAQTRSTSAQTRHIDRSISGAPTGGPSNGSGRPRKASANPREAVANALRRVNGSI